MKSSALYIAVLATLGSMAQAQAQIPLTLEDAQSYIESHKDNQISLGAQYVHQSEDATDTFVESTGYRAKGRAFNVGGDFKHRTDTFEVKGSALNVGTQIPRLSVEGERFGTLKGGVSYQKFTHLQGSLKVTTPTESEAHWQEVERTRDVAKVSGTWNLTDSIIASADYTVDHRHGDYAHQIFHSFAAWPAADFNVQPINSVTHQLNTHLQHIGHRYTGRVNYSLTYLDNASSYLLFENNPVIWNQPDTLWQDISADGTFTLPNQNTLDYVLGYNWATSVNTHYFVSDKDHVITKDSPIAEHAYLHGENTLYAHLGLISRSFKDWTLGLSYDAQRFHSNAEAYSNSEFRFQDGEVKENAISNQWSDPDYTEHKIKGYATYSFGHGLRAKVFAGYQDRKNDEILKHQRTYNVGVEGSKRLSDTLSGKATLEYTDRSSKDWKVVGLDQLTTPWNLAAYREAKLKVNAYSALTDALTLSVTGQVYDRHYRRGDLDDQAINGASRSNGQGLTFDLDWQVSESVAFSSFYSLDREFIQFGTQRSLINLPVGGHFPAVNTAGFGLMKITDTTHTFGVGAQYKSQSKPYEVRWDYTVSYEGIHTNGVGYTTRGWTGSWALQSNPISNLHTQRLTLQGKYRVNKQWDVKATAVYAHAKSSDTFFEQFNDGRNSPNFSAGLINLSTTYHFQ